MPRKKLIRTDQFPYHICTRSNNKEWFKLELEDVWNYCLIALIQSYEKCPIHFHSLVLMSNHYHLLVSTPDNNIDTFMFYFNKKLADSLRVHSKRINRIFGGPYNWSLITDNSYLYNVTRYNFQNPVRAGLVDFVQEYSFSSLYYEVNKIKFPIPIFQLFDNSNNSEIMINWYNTTPKNIENEYIAKGLRKAEFKPARDPNSNKTFNLTRISY